MGLGSWLKKAFDGNTPRRPEPRSLVKQPSEPQPTLGTSSVRFEANPCLEVAGTTTFAADAVAALADRKDLGELGFYEGQAQLQRDPENPVDP